MEEKQIDFLKAAIDDTQQTIRFIDAKAGVGLAIQAAVFATIIAKLPELLSLSSCLDIGFWILVVAFLLILLTATLILGRIIFPTSNPIDNLTIEGKRPESLFYISGLNVNGFASLFSNKPKYSKLKMSFGEYASQLGLSDMKMLIGILELELLKVSYIREIKTKRFKAYTLSLILLASLGMSVYFLYAQQHNQFQERILAANEQRELDNRKLIQRFLDHSSSDTSKTNPADTKKNN